MKKKKEHQKLVQLVPLRKSCAKLSRLSYFDNSRQRLSFFKGSCLELAIVLATPEEFENAAFFLRLSQPTTLIRHENAAFFLRLSQPTTLIRHENAAFFLRLVLPSTLIRHENGAFRKRSLNRRNLKTPL